MFNRQPFNRGKFNIQTTQSIGNSGIALMVMGANSIQANRIINASGIASMYMKDSVKGTNVKFSKGETSLILNTLGSGTKNFIVASDISSMVLSAEANQVLAGEQEINLNGIILKPGDELVINTCDMTVTINGQNAMEYFSNDSDFFTLLNGTNTLVYSDSNTSRNISFDVIWKDRWL